MDEEPSGSWQPRDAGASVQSKPQSSPSTSPQGDVCEAGSQPIVHGQQPVQQISASTGSRRASERPYQPPEGTSRSLFLCPPHGCKAICGARPHMEDAFTAVPYLLEMPLNSTNEPSELIPVRLAGQVRSSSGCLRESATPNETRSGSACMSGPLPHRSVTDFAASTPSHITSAPGSSERTALELSALHFFGVFDGHGGAQAALYCARTLHDKLAEALLLQPSTRSSEKKQPPHLDRCNDSQTSSCTGASFQSVSDRIPSHPPPSAPQAAAVAARDAHGDDSRGSSMDVDQQLSSAPVPPQPQVVTVDFFEQAFADAFSKVDEEFARSGDMAQIGTTAVVALIGRRQIYIANCGDSRAVLCRAGLSFPLTDDHKASREDEKKRIQDLGGEVMWWNGERVMGVLAVSRSIGDQYLRPYVISGPEVTILRRSDEDELLLLASDGLWDVLSNQDACSLAKRCLQRAQRKGASRSTAAHIAAAILTRAAVDHGSSDNITVVVVDLSPGNPDTPVKAESFSNSCDRVPASTAAPAAKPRPSQLQRDSGRSMPPTSDSSAPVSHEGSAVTAAAPSPAQSGDQPTGPSSAASVPTTPGDAVISSPIEAAAAIAVAAVDRPLASKVMTNVRGDQLVGQS